MDDQTAPKVTEVRMRDLWEVHRQPQRVPGAQVKLEPFGRFLVTYIRVSLKQKNPDHQRGRMRGASFSLRVCFDF
jgi:hypothetical protein